MGAWFGRREIAPAKIAWNQTKEVKNSKENGDFPDQWVPSSPCAVGG